MSCNNEAKRETIKNYTDYLILPCQIVGCWDWFPDPQKEYQIIINNVYLCMVLFVLTLQPMTVLVSVYTEWTNVMDSLDRMSESVTLITSAVIVAYFGLNRKELYELLDFMNKNFRFRSAMGLSNMTMEGSYKLARMFAYGYTVCSMFSVTVYVVLPVIQYFGLCKTGFAPSIVIFSLVFIGGLCPTVDSYRLMNDVWTKQPLHLWVYMDVTSRPFYVLACLRQELGQIFVGLAMGELSAFFAANAILMCGQLDLLCCSLRNARYTALLKHGIQHSALITSYGDIKDDEMHNYMYSQAELKESEYHYDKKMISHFTDKKTQFDIHSEEFEEATVSALRECARVGQIINEYKDMFERFMSPMLVLRVVQVTTYLCSLLYAITLNFDMTKVEYLGAATFDTFIYCYYGNQIILQADRVTTAVYQSAWPTMGVRSRRLLLNILLSNRRPFVVRAGKFLPMDLNTFIGIIKTSFSYYTLLVNVNEKK